MNNRDKKRQLQTDTDEFLNIKAHSTGDLKHFLKQYFLFRAYIVFKNGKKFHAYGNEHSCTYNQLRYGRFDNILLNREKGYTDLINMIEKKYSGKYTRAKIYSRQPGQENFNTICRDYNDAGQLEECQDPVLSDDDKFLTLYYYTHKGQVIITETDPAGENFKFNL